MQANHEILKGFSDNNWAGFPDDFISTSGYVFTIDSNVFLWMFMKQEVVAQSTIEAKYITTTVATI